MQEVSHSPTDPGTHAGHTAHTQWEETSCMSLIHFTFPQKTEIKYYRDSESTYILTEALSSDKFIHKHTNTHTPFPILVLPNAEVNELVLNSFTS